MKDKQKLIMTILLAESIIQIPTQSTLAFHGTVIGKGDYNHNSHSCEGKETRTRQLITRNSTHMKVTPITTEENLMDQVSKNTIRTCSKKL